MVLDRYFTQQWFLICMVSTCIFDSDDKNKGSDTKKKEWQLK